MKQLIILRHGNAESANWNNDDYSRKLTQFGRDAVLHTCKYFESQNCKIDTILSSEAPRAMETAKIAVNYLGLKEEQLILESRLYLASQFTLIKHIEKLDKETQVCLLVGHNPGLTDLINQFGVRLDYLPTASAVCFSINTEDWKDIKVSEKKFEWIKT